MSSASIMVAADRPRHQRSPRPDAYPLSRRFPNTPPEGRPRFGLGRVHVADAGEAAGRRGSRPGAPTPLDGGEARAPVTGTPSPVCQIFSGWGMPRT